MTATEARIAYQLLTAFDWESPRTAWKHRTVKEIAALLPSPVSCATPVSAALRMLAEKQQIDAPVGWPRTWLIPDPLPIKVDRDALVSELKKAAYLNKKSPLDDTVAAITEYFDWDSPERTEKTATEVAHIMGFPDGASVLGRALSLMCLAGKSSRRSLRGTRLYAIPPVK
jgi:hypothetical protein